jgi:hypothetical protein
MKLIELHSNRSLNFFIFLQSYIEKNTAHFYENMNNIIFFN